jgi:dTDP-glucose pyrophosphorylase
MAVSIDIWRQAMLTPDSSIQQAIQNLDEVAIKIVLVVSESGQLEGTISDGDIRRGLLRGLNLGSSISEIVHRSALVVPPSLGLDAVIQLMTANKIQQIPIVDERQNIVGLHLWDEITTPVARSNTMVIMAGGKGKRLMPHTEKCPKPLVPLAGKPMLEHIIDRAKAEGFHHFVLAIHYLGHMIEDYFGNGEKFDVRIEYLREPTPLGTAGGLGFLDPRPEEPFVVTNCDVITDIRYGELLDFHRYYAAAATMAVRLHEWHHPFGVVQTNGIDIVGFEEKPVARTHINAGVYALVPEALDSLVPGASCDMPALFEHLQGKAMRTVAYPMHEPWLDIGRPDDLKFAEDSINNNLVIELKQ